MSKVTSYRLIPKARPVNITHSEFVNMMLDELKPLYGPNLRDIAGAAIDALYVVLGSGKQTEPVERLDELVMTLHLGHSGTVVYALFWLWMQVKVGGKLFVADSNIS